MKIQKLLTAIAFGLFLNLASVSVAADALDREIAEDNARAAAARDDAALLRNSPVDPAATRVSYAAEDTARAVIPWVVGIALAIGLLYWAMRRTRTTHIPPVEHVNRDAGVPPVRTRSATGTYHS